MARTTIDYLLPLTRARLEATVETTLDQILETSESATTAHALGLVTAADPTRPRSLSLEGGAFADYAFELGLTEDGRLTQAGLETTGQLGAVLAAGVTLAAAAAAVATGNLPAAGAAAAAAARAAGETTLGKRPKADPVLDAYQEQHPELAGRLARLIADRAAIVEELDEARSALREAAGDPSARPAAHQRVETLKRLLADVDGDLDRAKAQFAAWRAGTLATTVVVYDELVPLGELPRYVEGKLEFPVGGGAAERFFAATGHVLATVGYEGGERSDAAEAAQRQNQTALHVLRPRPGLLAHVEGSVAAPRVTGFHRALVMDAGSEELTVAVRRSWRARRRTDLTLSELGAMTKVSYNGTSSAAATAATLGALPGNVAAGLEQAGKIATGLDALRDRPERRELDQIERDIALQEQRLLAAGQAATAADYAELQRLKQQKEIAELQAALEKAQRPSAGR